MGKIGLLFDLDGVVMDTETGYTTFWEEIDKIYPTGVDDFTHKVKGMNLASIISYFPTQFHQPVLQKLQYHEQTMTYDIFPDALRFINQARTAEIPIALVTSSGKQKLSRINSVHPDFFKLFDAIVTGDMVSHTKPHPECFLIGARKINVNITKCIVFEDSLNGIAAGIASGAKVVALTTTFPTEIKTTKADKFIDSFAGFQICDLYKLFT